MARPLYMIVAQSGATDKETNQVSHFNVVEHLEIVLTKTPVPKHEAPPPPSIVVAALTLQIVATWVPDEADIEPEIRYEAETRFWRPEEKGVRVLNHSEFSFTPSNYRLTVNLLIQPRHDFSSGVYRFESRIRKLGTQKWIRQHFVIPVKVTIKDVPHIAPVNGKKKAKHR